MATKKRKNKEMRKNHNLTEKEDRGIIKKMTAEEAEDFMREIVSVDIEPNRIMQELREDLLPRIKAGKVSKKDRKKTNETVSKALIICGLDNHYPLAETVGERYRPLVVEFARELIQEYNCQTPSEKALAQVVENCQKIRIEHFLKSYRNKLKELILASELEALGARIELTTSKTCYNGTRFWFKCPLCGKRVRVLLKHPHY